MQSTSSNEYGIVLLAAGTSGRLGTPKQLLLFEGVTLIKKAATIALEITDKVVIVIGSKTEKLVEDFHLLPLLIVPNEFFEEGIASSICVGLTALKKTFDHLIGVIFIVCDQPYLSSDILKKLIEKAGTTDKGIVASAYAGTLGVPALFRTKYFDRLLGLKGNTGAKKLINEYQDDVVAVDFPPGEVDIDTWEDYKALLKTPNGT